MFRAWSFTFRPRNGITDSQVEALERWMQKADFAMAVLHKHGEERHMHASVFLLKSTNRSNFITRILAIKGIEGTLDAQEVKAFRQYDPKNPAKKGVGINYNADFIENYMCTHDDPRIVVDTCTDNMEALEAYYPPPDDESAKRKFNGSIWYVKMEKAYYDDEGNHWFTQPMNFGEAAMAAFIHHRMYVSREIEVIADPRRLAAATKSLMHFIQKQDHPHPSIKKFRGDII